MMPPKLLKGPKGQSQSETTKEEKESWGTLPNLQHFGDKNYSLELQDGTKTKSQVKVQHNFNLHNQKKQAVNANRIEVVRWT
jgi:hypothetical protein